MKTAPMNEYTDLSDLLDDLDADKTLRAMTGPVFKRLDELYSGIDISTAAVLEARNVLAKFEKDLAGQREEYNAMQKKVAGIRDAVIAAARDVAKPMAKARPRKPAAAAKSKSTPSKRIDGWTVKTWGDSKPLTPELCERAKTIPANHGGNKPSEARPLMLNLDGQPRMWMSTGSAYLPGGSEEHTFNPLYNRDGFKAKFGSKYKLRNGGYEPNGGYAGVLVMVDRLESVCAPGSERRIVFFDRAAKPKKSKKLGKSAAAANVPQRAKAVTLPKRDADAAGGTQPQQVELSSKVLDSLEKTYSADLITKGKIKRPLAIDGIPYIAVESVRTGAAGIERVRAVSVCTPEAWGGRKTYSYPGKPGAYSYTGIRVKLAGKPMVLGKEARFVREPAAATAKPRQTWLQFARTVTQLPEGVKNLIELPETAPAGKFFREQHAKGERPIDAVERWKAQIAKPRRIDPIEFVQKFPTKPTAGNPPRGKNPQSWGKWSPRFEKAAGAKIGTEGTATYDRIVQLFQEGKTPAEAVAAWAGSPDGQKPMKAVTAPKPPEKWIKSFEKLAGSVSVEQLIAGAQADVQAWHAAGKTPGDAATLFKDYQAGAGIPAAGAAPNPATASDDAIQRKTTTPEELGLSIDEMANALTYDTIEKGRIKTVLTDRHGDWWIVTQVRAHNSLVSGITLMSVERSDLYEATKLTYAQRKAQAKRGQPVDLAGVEVQDDAKGLKWVILGRNSERDVVISKAAHAFAADAEAFA